MTSLSSFNLKWKGKWSSTRKRTSTSSKSLPLILKSLAIQSIGTCGPKLHARIDILLLLSGFVHFIFRKLKDLGEIASKLIHLHLGDLVKHPWKLSQMTSNHLCPAPSPLARSRRWPAIISLFSPSLHPHATVPSTYSKKGHDEHVFWSSTHRPLIESSSYSILFFWLFQVQNAKSKGPQEIITPRDGILF